MAAKKTKKLPPKPKGKPKSAKKPAPKKKLPTKASVKALVSEVLQPKGTGRGGPRPGSGRKPDWFKAEALKALAGEPPFSKSKIKFLSDVADGEKLCVRVTLSGAVVDVPAPIGNRLKAVEILGKWGGVEKLVLEGDPENPLLRENPFANITEKKDLLLLEQILKRARARTSTSPHPEG